MTSRPQRQDARRRTPSWGKTWRDIKILYSTNLKTFPLRPRNRPSPHSLPSTGSYLPILFSTAPRNLTIRTPRLWTTPSHSRYRLILTSSKGILDHWRKLPRCSLIKISHPDLILPIPSATQQTDFLPSSSTPISTTATAHLSKEEGRCPRSMSTHIVLCRVAYLVPFDLIMAFIIFLTQ